MKNSLFRRFCGKLPYVIMFSLFGVPTYSIAYGVAIGYGHGQPSALHAYHLAADWHWHKTWCASDVGMLTGYYDLKFTHYESHPQHRHHFRHGSTHNKNNSLSFTPMFRYVFWPEDHFHPFIEAGIGALALQKTRQSHRKLSTRFQFDDRINVGMNFGRRDQYEVSLGYNHISNGGIKKPNCGIDQKVLFTFRYWL